MSRNFERALAALDLAAAPAFEGEFGQNAGYGPPGANRPDLCWRCTASDVETDVGLCASCHEAMQKDETVAPSPRPGMQSLHWVQDAVQGSLADRVRFAYMSRLLLYGSVTRDELLADLGVPEDHPLRWQSAQIVDVMIQHAEHCENCQGMVDEARDTLWTAAPWLSEHERLDLLRAALDEMEREILSPMPVDFTGSEFFWEEFSNPVEVSPEAALYVDGQLVWSSGFEVEENEAGEVVMRGEFVVPPGGAVLTFTPDGRMELRPIDEDDRDG